MSSCAASTPHQRARPASSQHRESGSFRTSRACCRESNSVAEPSTWRFIDTDRLLPPSLMEDSEPLISGSRSCVVRERTRFHQPLRDIAELLRRPPARRPYFRTFHLPTRVVCLFCMWWTTLFATLAAAVVVTSLRAAPRVS